MLIQLRPVGVQEVLDLVASKGAPYAEPFPTLVKNTPVSGLYAAPLMEKLPHSNKAPVICIGDCLHPMTPFSGMFLLTAVHTAHHLFVHGH